MSVLVVAKFQGDTAKFRQALDHRGDDFAKIVDSARAADAIHHRFGVGDGFIVVIDEWDSAEHFQRFFADPSLQEFIASAGADPTPPEIMVSEAISSPDQF